MFEIARLNNASPSRPIDPARERILEIIYPQAGDIRARTVVSRSRARSTAKYPSWKMGRMMQCESSNERDAFILLDACPTVTAFYEQPLTLRYLMEGEVHTHYPDLLVEFGCRRELWEVKTLREATRVDVAARTRVLQAILPPHGFTYHVITAEVLAQRPRLTTAIELLKHGRQFVSDAQREHLRQILLAVPYITWASALNGDLGPNGRAVLSRLALEGVLEFDIEQPLTPSTLFSWRSSQNVITRIQPII